MNLNVTLIEHYTSPDFSTLMIFVHYKDEEKILFMMISTKNGHSYSKTISKEEQETLINQHWIYTCVYNN